eukprot:PLAT754.1.p1 GENE.PLAT754.1~~PLAT754.1.p1  ORF type:complete len:436 (+),score=162.09 PLAT754.1:111-1310(+)
MDDSAADAVQAKLSQKFLGEEGVGVATRSTRSRGSQKRAASEISSDTAGSSGEESKEAAGGAGRGSAASSRQAKRRATEEERSRLRERNRVSAKKSRLRKKYFIENLVSKSEALEAENQRLRAMLEEQRAVLSTVAAARAAEAVPPDEVTEEGLALCPADVELMRAIRLADVNFVITDPNLPDNPIVFASQGFYALTQYTPEEVIGRNCRFLQGPATSAAAVDIIRTAVGAGGECRLCLLNYRKDGSPFWNQVFILPVRDASGKIVNYVSMQTNVSRDAGERARARFNPTGAITLSGAAAAAAAAVASYDMRVAPPDSTAAAADAMRAAWPGLESGGGGGGVAGSSSSPSAAAAAAAVAAMGGSGVDALGAAVGAAGRPDSSWTSMAVAEAFAAAKRAK